MKKLLIILVSTHLIFSCGDTVESKAGAIANFQVSESEIYGVYHAIAPQYNLLNKFGDDMIINGKTISIPKIDHKFILDEGGLASLQQTNTEDGTRYYYDGKFSVVDRMSDKWIKVKCSLSDGKYSNPNFLLTIYPLKEYSALCQTDNAPEFTLKKIK